MRERVSLVCSAANVCGWVSGSALGVPTYHVVICEWGRGIIHGLSLATRLTPGKRAPGRASQTVRVMGSAPWRRDSGRPRGCLEEGCQVVSAQLTAEVFFLFHVEPPTFRGSTGENFSAQGGIKPVETDV